MVVDEGCPVGEWQHQPQGDKEFKLVPVLATVGKDMLDLIDKLGHVVERATRHPVGQPCLVVVLSRRAHRHNRTVHGQYRPDHHDATRAKDFILNGVGDKQNERDGRGHKDTVIDQILSSGSRKLVNEVGGRHAGHYGEQVENDFSAVEFPHGAAVVE